MLLNNNEIEEMCKKSKLIDPYCKAKIKGASYDLSLGNKCYVSNGSKKCSSIINLRDGEEVEIPPNSIFFFHTNETINLPKFIAAKLSLTMGNIRKGLIMPSQTQADPGWNHILFGMIYNLSNQPVVLKQGEKIVSIEFYKLNKTSDYSGSYAAISFEQFVTDRISSSLDELNEQLTKSVEKVDVSRKQVSSLTFIIAILTFLVTVFSIAPMVGGYFENEEKHQEISTQISNLEKSVNDFKQKEEQIRESDMTLELENMLKRIELLEKQVKLQEKELSQLRKGNEN